jgi:hypothetical protein
MAFNFRTFIKKLTASSVFDSATELAFKEIGKVIDKNAHNPDEIKKIGGALIKGAPDIVEAIKAGTEAEKK